MSRLPMMSAVRVESDRVVLRKACDADRDGLVELRTDPEVHAYLGGPATREAVEQRLDEIGVEAVTALPGFFVIADKASDEMLGTVELKRHAADLPAHVTPAGEELEVGYLLRRRAWGGGLAFEAVTALLRAAAAELPDQPVLLLTQTANERSLNLASRLGFRPFHTYRAWDAEQTASLADLHSFRDA